MNKTSAIFTLSRLFHLPGGADGVGKLVAASAGLTRIHWDECRRLAPLFPPPAPGYPQGAMGLFRGQTIDFILARTRVDSADRAFVEYVLLTADTMRQVAGRTRLLASMVPAEKLAEEAKGLMPMRLVVPPPPTESQLTDDLSRFMLVLQDDFRVMEGLLAALVQGMPVSFIHGPRELEVQLAVVQGLLSMLPLPARFGVTFSTYARRIDTAPVQLAFLANDAPPEGSLCYDWETHRLIGTPPDDPYSHFIIRQLRLDPASAITQMVALTRTAAWRLTRGESLADALGWAARRVALDAAVQQGQPADADLVAAVLREDPTLTPDLRMRYVRHLLAFTLALQEPGESEVLAVLSRAHLDVENVVVEMLGDAIDDGKARLVFQLIARWMALPMGPEGSAWQRRGQTAAAAYLRELVAAEDVPGLIELLRAFHNAPEGLRLGDAVPELVEIALPMADRSLELARLLFLLAADYLSAAPFQRLARMKDFIPHLPEPFRAGLIHFQTISPEAIPKGLLAKMAASFGEVWEQIVLARLVEWVIALERVDLIDVPTLGRLVTLARSPYRTRYR
ncbi:MAG: hypothetical protein JW910_12125, partial [Anaerolineae bacterium]|nr:hypothetical protein [Anaerolineae bacterium]